VRLPVNVPISEKSIILRLPMKSLFFAGLLATSAFACASFDLMLIPGVDGRTYRYDPANNVQLGSYTSWNTASRLITTEAGGFAYTSTGGTAVQAQNFSNGQFMWSALNASPVVAMELADTRLFTLLSGGSFQISNKITGAAISSNTLVSGNTWRSMSKFGKYVSFIGTSNSTNAVVYQQFNTETGVLGSIVTTSIVTISGARIGKAAGFRNSLFSTGLTSFSYVDSGGNLQLGSLISDANGLHLGTTSVISLSNFASTGLMPALVAGHSGFFAFGQDSTTATLARVRQYTLFSSPLAVGDNTFTAPGSAFSASTNPYQVGNVVAPEPGSLIALSLGICAVLRKRRAKK
jgi:hypothetical protein